MDDSKTEKNFNMNQKSVNRLHYCTFEEFTDPIGFAQKRVFSPIDSDQRSVFSLTSLNSDFQSISMTTSGESLNSGSTATSVWTPFSCISDCLSHDFSIGQTIRSDYNPKEFFCRLAPNKKYSKVEDLNEYYKQFERTCSPGWEELSEENSEHLNKTSDQCLDFVDQKAVNRLHYSTFEEFTDPIGFAQKRVFSPIDSDQRSVFSLTSLNSDFPSISMTTSEESLNSGSTATSVWTSFSGISDCLSPDFSPNKKYSKVEDMDEYYKQFGRTCSPGWEELSEENSDTDQSFDFAANH